MVPGLAVEEFSTPPSSPVLATGTTRSITATPPTADPDDSTTAVTASPNDPHDTPQQLGETGDLHFVREEL